MAATNLTVEILLPDTPGASGGTWDDITSDCQVRDPITITRGRPDEFRRVPPSRVDLTLKNSDGKYSSRNPTSPLFGLIGRNTPIRVSSPSVTDTFTRNVSGSWGTPDVGPSWSGSGSQYSVNGSAGLMSHGGAGILVQTLNIFAADVDIYVDIDPATPAGSGNAEYTIRTRITNSGNNYIELMAFGVQSSAPTMAVREFVNGSQVQLNGFPSISGVAAGAPFRMHAQVIGNTARIRCWAIGATEPTTWAATITNFNAANTGVGTVSMRSSIPGGWTNTPPIVTSFANFTLRSFRFHGEVESWPQSFEGKDIVWAPITANGITRRLNAPGTTKPALSALRRTLTTLQSGLIGWWPLENIGEGLTSAPSALTGGATMTIVDSSATRSTDDTFPGSDIVPMTTLGVGAAVGASNYGGPFAPQSVALLPSTGVPASGSSWSMMFWTRTRLLEDTPSTTTVTANVDVSGSPQIANWVFSLRQNNFSVPARVEVDAFALSAASAVVTGASFSGAVTMPYVDAWRALRVTVDLSGANHRLRVWLDETLVNTTTVASVAPGQPTGTWVQTQVTNSPVPISFGQLLFANGSGGNTINTNAAQLYAAGTGYLGDTATQRMTRICQEAGIAFRADAGATELVGPQRVAPTLDILQDAADVDGGILQEPRDNLGLEYRTHASLYNQSPALTLNYAAFEVAPSLEPVDDTDSVANEVTVRRAGGGFATVVQQTGPLNVQEPPVGIGRYAKDITLILASDSQCANQASWIKSLGTIDEARYPVVNVDLTALSVAGKTTLLGQALALDLGDRISITNPPAWLPPESIEQLAQGFREVLGSQRATISINAVPASAYDVFELETSTGDNLSRLPAAEGETTLFEALTSGQTRMVINSTTVKWIDSIGYAAQFPFDITASGERIRVTASANYLNANPYFEVDASSWTSQNGATIARSTAQFHEGAASLLITPNGSSFAPQATSEEVPAVAGRTYTVSAWIRSTNAATRKVGLFWYDASHSLLSSNEISTALSAGVWTQMGPTGFVAPANTAFLRIFTNDPSNPAASNTWFLDEATVTSGNLQVFTVTRSINGIAKAQTAGTAVQLFRPPRIAR